MKQLRLRNTGDRFTATRDTAGVPHIRAARWLDALYGLGYMHAVDRGTQLLFARSVASGRAAEEIAATPELLETDRFFRRIGLHRWLDREVELLSPRIREQLEAYCAGVSEGLQSNGRSWPVWVTGFTLRPWSVQSVLLVGQLLSFGGLAIGQLQNERLLIQLIQSGAPEEGLREMFAPRLDQVDFDLLRQVKMSNPLSDESLELLTDLPRLAGSNAWVVAPQRSATGGALLASDPHLEVNRLPAIWYEAVLEWGDRYAMGATLPGCPLLAVARTPDVSWGVTYMKGDTIDYFIEDCRPGGSTGWQYRRGDGWHDFQLREEIVARKGAEAEVVRVYENEQGVLEGDPAEFGEGYHLSIAWSGNYPGSGGAIASWLDVVHTTSAREAMDVVRECAQPTLCWVLADREGHIGMQACGRFPRRSNGYNGLAPIPAWDANNHWQGWISIEELPSKFDPPEGYIATANEELNPDEGPLLVTQPAPNYRKRRIVQYLSVRPAATVEDMQNLQYDVVSVQADELRRELLRYLPDSPLKQRLAAWDCSYAPDSREASLFLRLYRNVLIEIFGHEQGLGWHRIVYLSSRAGFSSMLLTCADRVLTRPTSFWWQDRDKGELIRRAAVQLDGQVDEPWSEVNTFHFTDRFFGSHRVGKLLGYNSRKYPMPGNYTTPFQGHVLQTATRESTFAPSYHFVTDMSTDEAWTNLPGGPSESRFSRYYKSDLLHWLTGQYKRLAPERAGEN